MMANAGVVEATGAPLALHPLDLSPVTVPLAAMAAMSPALVVLGVRGMLRDPVSTGGLGLVAYGIGIVFWKKRLAHRPFHLVSALSFLCLLNKRVRLDGALRFFGLPHAFA